jgi:hypothetical protein
MKPLPAVGKEHWIHAQPLIVRARQQGRSRTGADRTAHVEITKLHALGRHPVEVGRLWPRRSIEANIPKAHVVDEDDDHIGLLRPLGSWE